MAKAILEFDLSNPEDVIEHKRAMKSLDLALTLVDITNEKKKIEWSLESMSLQGKPKLNDYEVLDLVFDRIHQIIRDNNINLDEIVN
jgi:predicted nucleic acid-binding protein